MGSHINEDGQFQSDKYPTCPPGKVPLSVKDPMAQDLLWQYAQRRREVDHQFADDLERALQDAGYVVEVVKRARDVTPYKHGIYCTVGGGKPFVNPIVTRRWSEDGKQINFMLDSHNFDFRGPDDDMRVVELHPTVSKEQLERILDEDSATMARRPKVDQ